MQDNLLSRYSRNILVPEIGMEGQERIMNGRVLIVGMGAIGSVCALYLAANGVGEKKQTPPETQTNKSSIKEKEEQKQINEIAKDDNHSQGVLGIADYDKVEISNLQRQILYREDSLGKLKIDVAFSELTRLNSNLKINTHPHKITIENIEKTIDPYDIVVDGTDNPETKFLLNDTCWKKNKIYIFGGITGIQGQTLTVIPKTTACLRCLFPEPPRPDEIPKCSEMGIINSVAGIIASLQVIEVIKILLKKNANKTQNYPLGNEFVSIDLLSDSLIKKIPIIRSEGCYCQR